MKKEEFDAEEIRAREHTFRNALPQILATAAKNLLLLAYGMTIGVTTIAIPALEMKRPAANGTNGTFSIHADPISLTEEQISWFSSINFICVPLACFVSGAITQPIGRKKSMMALNIPFLTVWLLYYYATDVVMLYAALVISGLAAGLHEAPVITYVAEITQPHLRGMLGSTSSTTVIIGTVSQLILGNFFYWRTVVLINMAFPVIAFCALYFVPESPHWLIAKGRVYDAEKSLCWLRGWVEPKYVQEELNELTKFITEKRPPKSKSAWKNIREKYLGRRAFLLPHFIIIVTFLCGHFGGMMSLQTNAVRLFQELNSPVSPYTLTSVLGFVEFLGALTCVILVHWTGKRRLLIVTTGASSVSLFVLATYAYIQAEMPHVVQPLAWLPVVFLNLVAYLIHAAIRLLPWVLIGEIYPSDIRGNASAASAMWFYIFAFLANKSFLWTLHAIELSGLFCVYGSVMGVGCAFLYAMLPETEGFTLQEIETHFSKPGNIFQTKIKKNFMQITTYGTDSGMESKL